MASASQNRENGFVNLLCVDGKGWNIDLFEEKNNILHTLCANCGSVCKDAVELGCDHDDNDIFLYCNGCLMELMNKNNGNCPINNHKNAIVSKNRATRRLIAKCTVLCPYSIEYKERNKNINNAQMIDTNNGNANDEKEGMIAIKNNNILKGCNFKGQMSDLLQNHISECIKINDPFYQQNIIINKLKTENNELKQQNQQNTILQNQLFEENNELKQKIETLNAKVLLLENTMDSKHKKNAKLPKELRTYFDEKEIKNDSNNVINVKQIKKKKKLNKFWLKYGEYMTINGKTLKCTCRGRGWYRSCAYSAPVSSGSGSGIHEIKFKILDNNDSLSSISIGITAFNNCLNNDCFGKNKDCNYGYHSKGIKLSHETDNVKYGSEYGTNDIITLYVNFNKLTIHFQKNGKDLGILSNIEKRKFYYIAVYMYCGLNSSSLQIVSCLSEQK